MLPAAYHWQITASSAYLRFNYSTIAVIKPAGCRYSVLIMWRGREVVGSTGSVSQGIRHVGRWVAARDELPSDRRR